MLKPQGFKTTEMVDEHIALACQVLKCSRDDLAIEASAKGLIAGAQMTCSHDSAFSYLPLPSAFVNCKNADDMPDFSTLKFVLVVEKETVFMHLVQ